MMIIFMSLVLNSALNEFNGEPDFWRQVQSLGFAQSGVLVESEHGTSLQINANSGTNIPLLVWKDPVIEGPRFVIQGQIRGTQIVDGYVEMWATFADGSRYFTRTIAADGPLGRLSGDFDWRVFQLPFDTLGKAPAPVMLELNLVAQGEGSVEIGPLRLSSSQPSSAFSVLFALAAGLLMIVIAILTFIEGGKMMLGVCVGIESMLALCSLLLAFKLWSAGAPSSLAFVTGIGAALFSFCVWRWHSKRTREAELRRIQSMA